MTDAELLERVKTSLGLQGNDFHNDTLNIYIEDVRHFMKSSGVSDEVLDSSASVGVICRGVADCWNYGAGTASFSDIFKLRVLQLREE